MYKDIILFKEDILELYNPPYTITPQMLAIVDRISSKTTKLEINKSLDIHPRLRRINRIKSIHASLRIEANSLSLTQVEDVLAGHLVFGPQSEIQEVKNAYKAYELLDILDPYSLKDLLKAHGLLTKYLISESGSFRHGEEGVFSGNSCIFMAPPARFVPSLMEQLFDWMNKVKLSLHPLLLAAIFHYEFVFIHPFADGNGRLARLWHTALLSQWRPLFAYIPLESQIERFQQGYYDAIAHCHAKGSSTYFIEFILQQIDAILDEVLEQSTTSALMLDEKVQKLLSIMEPEVPYSATTLMEKLQLKSRLSFREHYLLPALELQLIKMTIPDKPTSRNQRYVRM